MFCIIDEHGYIVGMMRKQPDHKSVDLEQYKLPPIQAGHVARWTGSAWEVVPAPVYTPTAEEFAAELRAERDRRLAATDFTQLPDAPLSTEQRAAWVAYRQDLRDIPLQAGFPADVEWPVRPDAGEA